MRYLALALALVFPTGLSAHDIYHGVMRPNNSKISCCGDMSKGGDCRPVTPKVKDGITYFEKFPWDEKKIVGSPDNRYHICEKAGDVYCLLVPPGT